MKIIFAGTPDIAAIVLEKLLTTEHQILAVYSQPDRPSGRGRQCVPTPVKAVATAHQLPVHQPLSLKTPEAQAELSAYQADLLIVVAYGLILPKAVLEIPRLGCWNVHMSLLPRWRGAAPIQRAIEAGDTETGATIMQMDVGLDTGAMLYQQRCPIHPTDTAQTLHDRLAELGASALLTALRLQTSGQLLATPQSAEGVTYAHKLAKTEGLINWQQPAAHIVHQIHAFNPWPMAYTTLNGQTLRLWQAEVVNKATTAVPGTITAVSPAGIEVATAEGHVRLLTVQLPGGKAQPVKTLLQGHGQLFQQGLSFI